MLKNANYQEKFQLLNPWIFKIIDTVKKDLKQEHLQQDGKFAKQHFQGKNIQKLTAEDLAPAYSQWIASGAPGGEEIGEFIANRWLLKNTEIYNYFEEQLQNVNPEFNEIEELEKNLAQTIMDHSVEQFGALKTYIFSVLNSVVFPQTLLQRLHDLALAAQKQENTDTLHAKEKAAAENLEKTHEREIARLTDKYEKKLLGMQKKYIQDTERLKKQVVNLQKKLLATANVG